MGEAAWLTLAATTFSSALLNMSSAISPLLGKTAYRCIPNWSSCRLPARKLSRGISWMAYRASSPYYNLKAGGTGSVQPCLWRHPKLVDSLDLSTKLQLYEAFLRGSENKRKPTFSKVCLLRTQISSLLAGLNTRNSSRTCYSANLHLLIL
ncbi:hypothetical protein E2C01_055153 [Portunus trituberculatus]|uniref:Uncharacterized protein n=1 Tax=Portunus trituberculatus TaxID=210409 RepID=A0A5B7GLU3_PORTR|nr:hypothetical protein [Portunus trituberculatus]